jgi:hypothetical protein
MNRSACTCYIPMFQTYRCLPTVHGALSLKDTVQGLVWLFRYNRYGFLSRPRRTALAPAHALKNVSVETPEVQTSRFGSRNGGQEWEREGKVGLAKCEMCPAQSNRRVGLGRSYPRRSAGASPLSSTLDMERITSKHIQQAVLRPVTIGSVIHMPCASWRILLVDSVPLIPGYRFATELAPKLALLNSV